MPAVLVSLGESIRRHSALFRFARSRFVRQRVAGFLPAQRTAKNVHPMRRARSRTFLPSPFAPRFASSPIKTIAQKVDNGYR